MNLLRSSSFLIVIFFSFIFAYNIDRESNKLHDDFTLPMNPESYRIKVITMTANGTILLTERYAGTADNTRLEGNTNSNSSNDNKIVHGSPAAIRKFNYQVAVLTENTLCGGSLIKYDWVVTAQHCVVGLKANDFRVRAGSRKFYAGGVLAKVDLIVKHAGFNMQTLNNDIALLKLRDGYRRFRDQYPIKPIKLIGNVPPDGAKCVVSGFGNLSEDGNLPRYLQKAVIRKINRKTCNADYGNTLTRSMLCAGYLSGKKDACQGDSGGPLVYKRKLLGVVSFGNGCAQPDFPGVYTSIPKMKIWIMKALRKN